MVGLLAGRSGLGGLGEDTAPASPPSTDSRQSSSHLPTLRSHFLTSPPAIAIWLWLPIEIRGCHRVKVGLDGDTTFGEGRAKVLWRSWGGLADPAVCQKLPEVLSGLMIHPLSQVCCLFQGTLSLPRKFSSGFVTETRGKLWFSGQTLTSALHFC